LVDSGKIKARSKWKEVYPAFRDDERYLSMLGNPGSNPLELFWDIVDSLDQQLDEKIAIVEGAIARHNAKLGINEDKHDGTAQGDQKGESEARGFFVRAETSEEEFKNIVKANADDTVSTLTSGDLHVIYRAVRRSRFRNVLGG
jgi:pre-mRNA-processing factor 40